MASIIPSLNQPLENENSWQFWRRKIRNAFLVENKTKDEILEHLKDHGFVTSEPMLSNKLKEWGYIKNIPNDVWRYVESKIQSRKEQGKNTVVILSGRRFEQGNVNRKTNRSRIVAYRIPEIKKPGTNLPLYLCTPRGSSNDLSKYGSWPETLPWFQFCNSHLDMILGSIRQLPKSHIIQNIGDFNADTYDSELQSAAVGIRAFADPRAISPSVALFMQLSYYSLVRLIGSEGLATQLFASRSVDLLASRFDLMLPETYAGENLSRASTLVGGHAPSIQTELIKIVFYLASNNLILEKWRTRYRDGARALSDARLVIALCRLSGLTQPGTIRHLAKLSRSSLTLAGILETLYRAAVLAEAVDVVAFLLSENLQTTPDICITYPINQYAYKLEISSLAFAVSRGSIDLINVLLDAGADIHQLFICDDSYKRPLITVALFELSASRAEPVIKLLLHRGANVNTPRKHNKAKGWITPLHAAITTGSVNLVDLLVNRGADLNYTSHIDLSFNHRNLDKGLIGYTGHISYLGLAASCGAYETQVASSTLAVSEAKALDVCRYLLHTSSYGQATSVSESVIRGAAVQSIAHGYSAVFFLIASLFPLQPNAKQDEFSLLHVAIAAGSYDICKVLVQNGATLDAKCSLHSQNVHDSSKLHYSTPEGTFNISLFGQAHGVHCIASHDCLECSIWNSVDKPHLEFEMTPVELAILLDHHDIVSLLLLSGASASPQVILYAATKGDRLLVEWFAQNKLDMLLTHIKDASDLALSNGHGSVVTYLIELGAPIALSSSIWKQDSIQLIQMSLKKHRAVILGLMRDQDCRSYLENAILYGPVDVVDFAFSFDEKYYDSGALCAAVRFYIQSPNIKELDMLNKLVSRRNYARNRVRISPYLERVAMTYAVDHRRLDIIRTLTQATKPTLAAYLRTESIISAEKREAMLWWVDASVLQTSESNIRANWHGRNVADSPLARAVQMAREDIAVTLIEAGYEVDALVLLWAIRRNISASLLTSLIATCTDIDGMSLAKSRPFDTPLYVAIELQNTELVKTLISFGVRLNQKWKISSFGTTSPLGEAIESGHLPSINVLLDNGADTRIPIWSPLEERMTPLMIAAGKNHIGLVLHLLAHGAELNPKVDLRSYSPLLAAATAGRLDMTKLLLELGAYTEGLGQIQYVKSIWTAKRKGFHAVEELLRSHRRWTAYDDTIWRRLDYNHSPNDTFQRGDIIHSEEFTPEDFVAIISEYDIRRNTPFFGWHRPSRLNNWQKKVANEILQVVKLITHTGNIDSEDVLKTAIQITTDVLENFSSTYYEEDSLEDLLNCDNIDVDVKEHAAEFPEVYEDMKVSLGWFDHPNHIGKHAYRVASLALQQWASSLAVVVADIEIQLEPCTQSWPPAMDMWPVELDDTSLMSEDRECGGHYPNENESKETGTLENDEDWDQLRKERFRRDMAGEEEAPFIPMIRQF